MKKSLKKIIYAILFIISCVSISSCDTLVTVTEHDPYRIYPYGIYPHYHYYPAPPRRVIYIKPAPPAPKPSVQNNHRHPNRPTQNSRNNHRH